MLIDSVLVSIIILSWWVMFPLMDGWLRPVLIAYPVLAVVLVDPVMVSLQGASPGHHLMGITIQDVRTGKNIGLLRAVVRSLLRGLLGWLSLVLVLTTTKHQALHDLLCRTTVLLRDPESLPPHEKFTERNIGTGRYKYPSKARRVLVISAYLFVILLLVGVVSAVVVSDVCLEYNDCSVVDGITSVVMNLAFTFGCGAAIVFGWRAQLFGCRRQEMPGESD